MLLKDIKIFYFFQFLAAILIVCGKQKIANILETVRDRAILIEFSTRKVAEESSANISEFSNFTILRGHLEFLRKTKSHIYLKNRKR